MDDAEREGWTPLTHSPDDVKRARAIPDTPQSRSPSYRLAFTDEEFLCREELRPVRLQLELLKPEMTLAENGIRSTVVFFGSARIPAPGHEPGAARNAIQEENLKASAKFYSEARRFARLCSEYSARTYYREFVVVTGGGPGIMEAGNRGADDVGAPSIGLNVVLPHEQVPNNYVTPELCFNFHYFAIRKMHFLMRARAIAIFPGGFGTLDEFFESVTLIQTKRMERMPLILFGREFWRRVVDFEFLVEQGTVAPGDLDLVTFVDTADEAWAAIRDFYDLQ